MPSLLPVSQEFSEVSLFSVLRYLHFWVSGAERAWLVKIFNVLRVAGRGAILVTVFILWLSCVSVLGEEVLGQGLRQSS